MKQYELTNTATGENIIVTIPESHLENVVSVLAMMCGCRIDWREMVMQ